MTKKAKLLIASLILGASAAQAIDNYSYYHIAGMNDSYMKYNNGNAVKLNGSKDSIKTRIQVFDNGNDTYSFKMRKNNGGKRYFKVANNKKIYPNTKNRFQSKAQFYITSDNQYIRSKGNGNYLTDDATTIKASISHNSVDTRDHGGFAFHKCSEQKFK